MFSRLFKSKQNQEPILKCGNRFVIEGKEVIILKRRKDENSSIWIKNQVKYNAYQSVIAKTKDGQRIVVQESDVCCRLKLTKTVDASKTAEPIKNIEL